ncbi:MAG: hypothetical protein E7639_00365 [Ruminococcaceae bacterium]|nr:hypothetical protein [Oscillospiraceae bacterium]
MFDVQILVDVAIAAVAILVAILAVYLAMRLLGKLAKFAIGVIVVALVLWFVFSDNSFLSDILPALKHGANFL